MKKRMIVLIFPWYSWSLLVLLVPLYAKRAYTFTAPAAEDLKRVSLHAGVKTEEITAASQLQDLLNAVIKDGRTTTKESLQDSPINKEKVIRLVFNYKANTTSVTYMYQENDQGLSRAAISWDLSNQCNDYDAVLELFNAFKR